MEGLWVQRNIENRTAPQYFNSLALSTLNVSSIEDLDATGLTIEANKGGTLAIQNPTAGGITINSTGNITVDSSLGTLILESTQTDIRSVLGALNIQSPVSVNITSPILNCTNVRITQTAQYMPTVAPSLTNISSAFWFSVLPDKRPLCSICTTALPVPVQNNYNVTLESISVQILSVNFSSNIAGAWSAPAMPLRFFKIGRLGFLYVPRIIALAANNFTNIYFTLTGSAIPLNNVSTEMTIQADTGVATPGSLFIIGGLGTGVIEISTPITIPPYPAQPLFQNGKNCGIFPVSIMYETGY